MISEEDEATKAVVYSVTMLHAVLADRGKFGRVGWNVPYAFTEMEYQNSLRLIKEVINRVANPNCVKCNLDEIDEIEEPMDFSAFRHFIGEINY